VYRVEEFRDKIKPAWYRATEDTKNWEEFGKTTYFIDYASATAETLKQIAWNTRNIRGGPDEGMWSVRVGNLEKFLGANMALSDEVPIERTIIEYDFIACFLNDYRDAAHNEDLWRAINQAAVEVLSKEIGADTDTPQPTPPGRKPYEWVYSEIPEALCNAIREINLSYYRPTEDTLTWASFQRVALDLTDISRTQYVFRHAYLLSNIASTADPGIWEETASAARAFLVASLGKAPTDAAEQLKLAADFCEIMNFDYTHAKHNEDLFKAYHDAFEKAAQEIRKLPPTD
jgi:hypothetical protein